MTSPHQPTSTRLERLSKAITCAAVLVLAACLVATHRDVTWPIQAGAALAFAAGLAAGHLRGGYVQAACVLGATLGPALLRLATGREGSVLDLVWMAGLAGALLRSVPWTRWTLPQAWRPLAAGWALALTLAWPVLVAREAGFDLAGVSDEGALVSWAQWSAPRAVAWILYWVLAQLLGVLWLEWIGARMRPDSHATVGAHVTADARGSLRFPPAAHALWMGATVASVVAVVQGTISLSFLSTDFWAANQRAAGTLLDANGYGHVAALAGPVAFLAARALLPHAPPAAWLLLAVNWVGLWMSGSRTALLCAVFGGAGVVLGLRVHRARTSGARTIALALAGAAVFLILLAGATGPLRRLMNIPISMAGLTDVVRDRGGYGSSALQVVREYPLTGTGPGTFHFVAPDYYRAQTGDALEPDNAQNWWRHQAAELGALGGAAVLLWSAVIGWRVFFGRTRLPAPADNGTAPSAGALAAIAAPLTVRGLLLGIGASSLFGVPTQSPIVLIWFFFLVAWLDASGPGEVPAPDRGARWLRPAWIAAVVLAIAYAAVHVALARGPLSVLERARRFDREYIVGAQPPEPYEGASQFRWTGRRARFFLPAQTPWLALRIWAAHPDVAANPVRARITTPCGVLWDEALTSPDPRTIGLALPPGLRAVEAAVEVSRTWQPSAYGEEDTRQLGAGIVTDFIDSAELARSQMYTPVWPVCDNALLPSAEGVQQGNP